LKILKKRKVVAHFFDPGENNLAAAEKGLNRPLVRKKVNARRVPAFPHARRPGGLIKQKYAKRKGASLLPIVLFQGIVAQINGAAGPWRGVRAPGQAGRVALSVCLKIAIFANHLPARIRRSKYVCVDT
jgi:hypothetical protein